MYRFELVILHVSAEYSLIVHVEIMIRIIKKKVVSIERVYVSVVEPGLEIIIVRFDCFSTRRGPSVITT